MPGESVPVAAQLTKAPMALVDFLKKYWFMGPGILILLLFIGMAIKPWFTKATTTANSGKAGDKLPTFLRNFLRITSILLPVGFVLLGADYAFAACAGHAPCVVETGWLSQIWQYLAGIAGAGILFGITHSAPDVLDAKDEHNGRIYNYTPGSAFETSLFMKTATKYLTGTTPPAPLIAVDTTIAIDTTVEQVATGTNPIVSQDLARLLEWVEISTPFHGMILDKETGTGPVLDLAISFVSDAFSRCGDAPTVTITVPAVNPNDVAVTKYFTFPWAQRILDQPSLSAPWLLTLDEANIAMKVAADTALAAVSTGANTQGASHLRAATSYEISPVWRQNYVPYWRVDKPASGSDGLLFQNFGGTGPSATKQIDIVHTIGQLSNLAGLPGNLTFDTVTGIVAPSFGLDDIANVDLLVKARIEAQSYGRIGAEDYTTGGNHRTGAINNGMALDQLLFLLLRQPSLDMPVGNMLRFDSKTKLPLREVFSAPRTGADAFIIGGLRELSAAKMQEQSNLSGGKMPVNYAQARHFRG